MLKKLFNFIIIFMLVTVVFATVQINVKADIYPIADANGPYYGDEGVPVDFDGSNSSYININDLEYRWKFNGAWTNWSKNSTAQHTWYDDCMLPVTLEVRIINTNLTDYDITDVTISNLPPIVNAGEDIIADEGDLVWFNGSFTDVPLDTHIFYWNFSNGEYVKDILNFSKIYADDFIGNVTLYVEDDDHIRGADGNETDDVMVIINNVAPNITKISGPSEPLQLGELIPPLIVNFSDPGIVDTHDVEFDWGDGFSTVIQVDEEESNMTVTSNHQYYEPGVYIVNITVKDDDGGIDIESYEYVVVFDSESGFVTGGGWIGSPKGAYKDNENAGGKATFGFVSKYKKGQTVPTGNTQFNFNSEYLHFHSSEYYWLVIAGAKAMFKGIGTIQGREGDYKFIITAWDGDLVGEEDTFRIKIWQEDINGDETEIYDTGNDSPLLGGEIMIHKNGL